MPAGKDSPVFKTIINLLVEPIKSVIKEEIGSQEKKIDKLTETISSLETELKDKNKYINLLELRIDELEQYSRRNCLVFTGIPENENENTDKSIIDIAKNVMKVDIDPRDIDRSHRIPGGPARANMKTPRNIVVKFTNYNSRKRVFDNKKELKGCKDRVFVNEQLTKYRSELFYETRKLAKQGKIKQTWTSDGRILIRNHDDKIQPVKSMSDIMQFRLCQDGPLAPAE